MSRSSQPCTRSFAWVDQPCLPPPRRLCDASGRVLDSGAKVVITQDGVMRGGKLVALKGILDAAVPLIEQGGGEVRGSIVLRRLGNEDCAKTMEMVPGRDFWCHPCFSHNPPPASHLASRARTLARTPPVHGRGLGGVAAWVCHGCRGPNALSFHRSWASPRLFLHHGGARGPCCMDDVTAAAAAAAVAFSRLHRALALTLGGPFWRAPLVPRPRLVDGGAGGTSC